MTYGIEIWGNSAHTETILTMQKRAARAIIGATQTAHCKPIFRQLDIPTVYADYIHKSISKIHQERHLRQRLGEHHTHQTRNREKLRPNFTRLRTTNSQGPQVAIYNVIPDSWKLITGVNDFKRLIRDHLIKAAPYGTQEFLHYLNTNSNSNSNQYTFFYLS